MRKTKLTYDMVETTIELKMGGLNDCDIIDAPGVRQSTFYRWLKVAQTGYCTVGMFRVE